MNRNKKGEFAKVPLVYRILEKSEKSRRRQSKKLLVAMFLAIAPWVIAGDAYTKLAGVSHSIYLVNKVSAHEEPQKEEPKEEQPLTIEEKIKKTFPEDPETAIAVAKAESKLNPNVVGDKHIEFVHEGKVMGHSCGIFQIRVLPGRPDCETLTNEDFNLQYARKLYDKSGWKPWSAYKNGAYLKWL